MTDFKELIPEMQEIYGPDTSVETWLGYAGSLSLAIGYSKVFWPRFVEFERYVLREGFSVQSLRGFESYGDRRRIESVMNHVHFYPLLTCGDTHERLVYLGRVLSEIYRAKLAWQFPTKRFEVYFHESPIHDITDYQLTFAQLDVVA